MPTAELVARREEQERIRSVLGARHLLLLSGETGVGKTRALQELMQEASARSFVVLTSRCYATEQKTSHYPFLDALPGLTSRLPAHVRLEGQRAWKGIQEIAGRNATRSGAGTGVR